MLGRALPRLEHLADAWMNHDADLAPGRVTPQDLNICPESKRMTAMPTAHRDDHQNTAENINEKEETQTKLDA